MVRAYFVVVWLGAGGVCRLSNVQRILGSGGGKPRREAGDYILGGRRAATRKEGTPAINISI